MDKTIPLGAVLAAEVEIGAMEMARPVLDAVAAAVAKHQGRVFSKEGNGLLAVFTADEIAPMSALQSAIDSQVATKQLKPSLFTGASCGPVRLVQSGSSLRVEGDCVVVALAMKKLLDRRPGLVLLDAKTVDFLSMRLRNGCTSMGRRHVPGIGAIEVQSLEWDNAITVAPTRQHHNLAASADRATNLLISAGGIRQTYQPSGEPVRVGRSSTCDVMLSHLDVSREHLELRWESTVWVVKDISRHGTYLRTSTQDKDMCLLGITAPLPPSGSLGLGRSVSDDPKGATTIEFELKS